ncbi:hypothetical protein Tco_1244398 [Tanacetum coccineum]
MGKLASRNKANATRAPHILCSLITVAKFLGDLLEMSLIKITFWGILSHLESFQSRSTIGKLASRKVPALYDGHTIVKTHDALIVPDSEETLTLVEESRLKMHAKQNAPDLIDNKVNIKPVDYVALNRLSEHFEKHFVPQKPLSIEHAFWLPMSQPVSETPLISSKPVVTEEIPS